MKSLILIGNGGHCRSCIEIIETTEKFIIKGIVVHTSDSTDFFMDYKVLGNDNDLKKCFNEKDLALICVGQIESPEKRINLFNILKKNKISIATVISKFSIVSKNTNIGSGSVIMHNVVVNSGAKIGVNCILNTNSLIEHDVKIGDHCHISTGVIINGNAKIGDGCFIGSGAIIREGVEIGNKAIISAGEIVMENVPQNVLFKTQKLNNY